MTVMFREQMIVKSVSLFPEDKYIAYVKADGNHVRACFPWAVFEDLEVGDTLYVTVEKGDADA